MHIIYRTAAVLFLLHARLSAPSCLAAERWSPYCINEGEGGQVIVSVAAGKSDPEFVMFGTDVGGLYRSTDGGAHWIATGAGFDALTGLDIAIDPSNADHVLVAGSSPAAGRYCGVYRSADKGVTWTQVLTDDKIHDVSDRRGNRQLVIDGSSYDASRRFCTRVYYSSGTGVCYASSDGGNNWTKVPALAAKSLLAINSRTGSLFAAQGKTLCRSNDRGTTFQTVFTAAKTIGALDAGEDAVVLGVNTDGKVYRSTNNGDSFKPRASQGIPAGEKRRFISLKASPANSTYMMAFIEGADQPKLVSHDGGDHWTAIDVANIRHSIIDGVAGHADVPFAWHPSDANVCWEARHDFMTKSTDGGRSFSWCNRGYAGIFAGQGGTFYFNVNNPDLLALPSVDWNGAVTHDGGRTWQHLFGDPSVYPWWGWTYGCYCVEPGVWFFGSSKAHSPWNQQLKVTRDGGRTFETYDLNVPWRPSWSCYQDPADAKVWFYCNYRSTDAGHTWRVTGADVLTHDPVKKTLYGRSWEKTPEEGWVVLKSDDHGATWQRVFHAGGSDLKDIAVDHLHNIVYGLHQSVLDRYDTSTKKLTVINDFPADQYGNGPNLWSVAIDPVDPRILYVANGGHFYQPDTSVMRSVDRGRTWKSLSVARRLGTLQCAAIGGGGCVEALWCRVHPQTRELLVGTNDFGFWKFGPPVSSPIRTAN